MTRMPFAPQDRAWLVSRLIILGLVLSIHPLPSDLRRWNERWDLIIPAHSAQIAYVVFEFLQAVVFGTALFFGDMFPGMRALTAQFRRVTAEILAASPRAKFLKIAFYALGCGVATALILESFDAVVNAVPPGTPRFCAATVLFVVDRFLVVCVFVVIANASDDDDDEPGARRRSIAQSLAMALRLGRPRAVARAPVTMT